MLRDGMGWDGNEQTATARARSCPLVPLDRAGLWAGQGGGGRLCPRSLRDPAWPRLAPHSPARPRTAPGSSAPPRTAPRGAGSATEAGSQAASGGHGAGLLLHPR